MGKASHRIAQESPIMFKCARGIQEACMVNLDENNGAEPSIIKYHEQLERREAALNDATDATAASVTQVRFS